MKASTTHRSGSHLQRHARACIRQGMEREALPVWTGGAAPRDTVGGDGMHALVIVPGQHDPPAITQQQGRVRVLQHMGSPTGHAHGCSGRGQGA